MLQRLKIKFILVLFCFDRIYGLKECENCVFISSCKNAKLLEDRIDDPVITEIFTNALCDFQMLNGFEKPKICCFDFSDLDITNRHNDFNADKIANHNNLVLLPDDCGPLDPSSGVRIIGGTNANLYEYPWMALLSFRREGSKYVDFKCGGTIINSRYILTAAHCFDNKRDKLEGVRVGEYEIGSSRDCQGEVNLVCESHIQNLYAKKIIRHENYNDTTLVNDIALIRTKSPIDFRHRNVKPICLPLSEDLRNKNLGGVTVSVAGWGRIINKSLKRSKILQTVNIPVWDEEECTSSHGGSDAESEFKILCAGEKGKDSCNGDSGGPLMAVDMYLNAYRMVQFGVVSNGPRLCGTEGPGIYTDLTKYIYWILENIEE